MEVIFLMAGRGSRLGTKTKFLPKALLPINGKSLFERNMENLREAGFEGRPIGLVGYMHHAFPSDYECDYRVSPEWESTSQVQTLQLAASELSAARSLVLYGDVLHNKENLETYLSTDSDLGVVGNVRSWRYNWAQRYDNPLEDLETFSWDHDSSLITEIGRKPESIAQIDGQFAGAAVFTPGLWDFFERTAIPEKQNSFTGCLDRWVTSGNNLRVVSAVSPWFEIDTVRDLRFAEACLP